MEIFDEEVEIADFSFVLLEFGPSHHNLEVLKMHLGIGGMVVYGNHNLSRFQYFGLSDTSGEGIFPSFFGKSVAVGYGASCMVDLRFHNFYFRSHFRDITTEIFESRRDSHQQFSEFVGFCCERSEPALGPTFLILPRRYFLLPSYRRRTKSLAELCGFSSFSVARQRLLLNYWTVRWDPS